MRRERGEGLQDVGVWAADGAGGSSVSVGSRRRWRGQLHRSRRGGVGLPGGVASARAELRGVLDDQYEIGLAALDDAAWPISVGRPSPC